MTKRLAFSALFYLITALFVAATAQAQSPQEHISNPPNTAGIWTEPCPKMPTRPTTAVEVYRYEFCRYPLRMHREGPYYEIKVGGLTLGTPYNVDENYALEVLRGYYHNPLPGLNSHEISELLLLLEPDPPKHKVQAVETSTEEGPEYTLQSRVDRPFIPEPHAYTMQMWEGTSDYNPFPDDTHKYSHLDAPSQNHQPEGLCPTATAGPNKLSAHPSKAAPARESTGLNLRPETVVGKVHSLDLALTIDVTGTAWCLDTECDLMVTNYHVARIGGNRLAVNGIDVADKLMATGADDVDVTTLPTVDEDEKVTGNVVRDLAILRLKAPLSRKGMHGVPLFLGALERDEPVTVLSYPNRKLMVASGRFQSIVEKGVLEFVLDSDLDPGSGGGLILNARGEAVGILFDIGAGERSVYAIPIWSLADLVKSAEPQLYADLFPFSPYRPDLSGKPKVTERPMVSVLTKCSPGTNVVGERDTGETNEYLRPDAPFHNYEPKGQYPPAVAVPKNSSVDSLKAAPVTERINLEIQPETVVGKVHSPAIPFTVEYMGTAWCLNTQCDFMITNYHVAQAAGRHLLVKGTHVVNTWMATGPDDVGAQVFEGPKNTFKGNIVRDLAILQLKEPLSGKGMHAVPFFSGALQHDEPVTIFSYPNGKLTATTGRFKSQGQKGTLVFDLDSSLAPGASGGLILNTQGQAVGVLFALTERGETAYAIPMWSVADFVKKTTPGLYANLFPTDPYRPGVSGKTKVVEGPIVTLSTPISPTQQAADEGATVAH